MLNQNGPGLPQIAQFVELIRLLDQLMIVMDTLWLCQVISNKHCKRVAVPRPQLAGRT
ncbi:hypothetical protein [Methylomonas rapida]|uniref:Uncharacterized protein n=1 Tax=Methylomonas rapida TaxID=2963939 RepID=A0ABY7GRJ9_9GAMM|nr:hypothetical protein [Methylomonas rapida]WAR47115.1 hypothetical protein NM686_007225 [Methylomonas rapida]